MTTATKERKKSKAGTSLAVADLKRALAAVAPAVPSRSPKPVLTNVLLSGETVAATDLEMRIVAPLDCYDGPPMLLPHQRLTAIVKELPDGDVVTLTRDGSSCVLSGTRVEYRLPTEDASEFPPQGDAKSKSIARLPGSQFVSLVQSVEFAADTESSRYALGGVLIQLDRPTDKNSSYSKLSFVGTDGRRLCVASCQIAEDTDECRIIVPQNTMKVLCGLAQKDNEVHLSHSANELVAIVTPLEGSKQPTEVRSALVHGKFPAWETSFPERSVAVSRVLRSELLKACRQAAICTSEQSKGVTFMVSGNELRLTSQSSEYGNASVTADLIEAGHACTVKLDPRFVTQWVGCKSFDDLQPIDFEAQDAESALVLRAQDCRCVVMPLAAD